MIGNIFQQLYTFVDTVVVGKKLEINALAALGTTEWLIFFIIGAIQGITHGFSVIVAQCFGNRKENNVEEAVSSAIILSLVFSILFTVLGLVLVRPLLSIIKVPEEVYKLASIYLTIIYAGIPVTFAYNMMAAILRALGNSRAPLKAITISSICNGILDVCFVMGFHWGIGGAAIATVISQIISAIYCYWIIKHTKELQTLSIRGKIDKSLMLEELRVGLPLGLQNMITAIGGLVVQSVINGFGVLFIAGYTAANRLYVLLEIPASSYGYTMTTYTAQNIGADEKQRVKSGLFAGVIVCVCTAVLMSMVMIFAGDKIVSCFISGSTESVIRTTQIAHDFLMVLAVFFPLLYILFTVRGCVQGMGNSVLPMVSSFIQLVMRVGCALLLTRAIGEYGVFWGEVFAWIGADLLLIYGVFKGLNRKVLNEKIS